MTNNLQGDVHIASVRTSCGCTTPYVENDKRTLKTYETGAIIAHLNSGTHIGQRAATLTVTFDRPYYAEVQLQIRALVHTNILMEPTSLQFGTVEQGKAGRGPGAALSRRLPQLADPERSPLRSESARRSGPVGAAGRPGLVRSEGPPGPHGPAGYISDHAVLTTNDPSMGQIPVQVEGQVRPNVVVSPADLFLGVVHAGQKVTKPLVVRADKPFRIKSITGDKASFEIPQPPGDARSVHVVPVTFVAGAEIGKVVKTIHIETDIGGAQATSYAVVNEERSRSSRRTSA